MESERYYKLGSSAAYAASNFDVRRTRYRRSGVSELILGQLDHQDNRVVLSSLGQAVRQRETSLEARHHNLD